MKSEIGNGGTDGNPNKRRIVRSDGGIGTSAKTNNLSSKEHRMLDIEPRFSNALLASRVFTHEREVFGRTKRRKEGWPMSNSSINSYQKSFEEVLEGKTFVDLLYEKEGLLVVDLMAPTRTLATLFKRLPDDPTRRGIALSLTEKRSKWEEKRDQKLGIEKIAGDLSKSKTWRCLKETMGEQKADIITERALGGLNALPKHPQFYRYALQWSWDNLNEKDGKMFFEIPKEAREAFDINL